MRRCRHSRRRPAAGPHRGDREATPHAGRAPPRRSLAHRTVPRDGLRRLSHPAAARCFDRRARRPHACRRRAAGAAARRRSKPGEAGSVLIADDNAVNALLASSALTAAGFRVDTAGTGAEALERIGENDYAVVFMDIRMPVMDGLEATRRIRRLAGPASQTPIVALTADINPELEDQAREAGVSQLAAKPIDPPRLRELAARWAQKKKPAGRIAPAPARARRQSSAAAPAGRYRGSAPAPRSARRRCRRGRRIPSACGRTAWKPSTTAPEKPFRTLPNSV